MRVSVEGGGSGGGGASGAAGQGGGGADQERVRMPRMPLEQGRGAVVRSDDEHVGGEARQARNEGVELLDGLHLGLEVAVLPGRIGPLEVDIEEMEILVT